MTDVEVSPEGRLQPRPGAAWRPEPARGEVAIHRRLAALVDASDVQIARFASVHGFLRRDPGATLGPAGPASEQRTAAIGQESVDDAARVQTWIEHGAYESPPAGTEDTLAAVAVYAGLPDSFLDAFDAVIDGTTGQPMLPPDAFVSATAYATIAAGPASIPYLTDPGRIRAIDPARLRRALRINEYVSRLLGGLEQVPADLAEVGGVDVLVRSLFVNLPEAYAIPELLDGPDGPVTTHLRSLATETVVDWRTAARDIGTRVRSVDICRRAAGPHGISDADKRELARAYAALATYSPPADLSAAELAERVRPLLALDLESELVSAGMWPIRQGALAGLYVRALASTWTELAEASPPRACATPGCHGLVPRTRNRRYCDQCQSNRRRESVRRTRSMGRV